MFYTQATASTPAETQNEVTAEKAEDSNAPQQIEMPFAVVQGQPITKLPEDLYIPPDALEVILEAFEGPLDLLLYLIKRQNLDILEIPITAITVQYVEYVELMKDIRLELAGEYLVMAAMLAEIKSRMLLPRPVNEEGEEEDPRAELIRRLQEYERFKKASEDIDELLRQDRDIFIASAEPPEMDEEKPLPDVELKELILAFKDVMARVSVQASHQIQREPLSIRERMSDILHEIKGKDFVDFTTLFKVEEGRMGVVVSFIAVLELLKQHVIEIIQAEPFSPIHIKAAA